MPAVTPRPVLRYAGCVSMLLRCAGSRDLVRLTPQERVAVVTMLARLAGDSGAARTQLADDDAARKEDRKQLDDLRKQARK